MTHTLAFLAGYTVASGMWIVVVLCVMGAEEHPDDRRERSADRGECEAFLKTWERL